MSERPKLLDLFCGAGGAAMGYYRAGFDVVGVDIKPQPRYPFEFHQADAMTFPLDGFDAIHASPPCQGYSRLRHLPWLKDKVYPMLIDDCRSRLQASGSPWIIENVEDAPLGKENPAVTICGFSLTGDERLTRHRKFETNFAVLVPIHQRHPNVIQRGRAVMSKRYKEARITGVSREVTTNRTTINGPGQSICGHFSGMEMAKEIMGIDWMKRDELAQAIPPAYTEYIGGFIPR